jgi:hypothetical protein
MMDNRFWKGNSGKLFLGGCGTQLGLVVGFVVLGGTLLLCSVCAVSGGLGVAVAGQTASLASQATPTPSPDAEVDSLRSQINALISQVEVLRSEPPAQAAQPAPPTAPQPKPIAIATMAQINLRSGPGVGYNRVGTFSAGESLEIVGRNQDATWWLVNRPDGLAWVSAKVVITYGDTDAVPVVAIPALLVWPDSADDPAGNAPGNPAPVLTPAPAATEAPNNALPAPPAGTPTATAAESRIFVEDTVGWKRLREQLGGVPLSESFSPRGERIAVIDGVKLYLVAGDGSYGQIVYADDGVRRPVRDAAWSPDGQYLAFTADYVSPKCHPCRSVGLVDLSDGTVSFLPTPEDLDSAGPRWTQDGRLLVNVYPGEPADGKTYVYDAFGNGQVASGVYLLSSSQDGQRWLPWRPGRVWRAGVSERPDTYYQ